MRCFICNFSPNTSEESRRLVVTLDNLVICSECQKSVNQAIFDFDEELEEGEFPVLADEY